MDLDTNSDRAGKKRSNNNSSPNKGNRKRKKDTEKKENESTSPCSTITSSSGKSNSSSSFAKSESSLTSPRKRTAKHKPRNGMNENREGEKRNLTNRFKKNGKKKEKRISKKDKSKQEEEEELNKKKETSLGTLQKLVKLVNSNLNRDKRLCREIIRKNKDKIYLEEKHKWNDELKKEFSDIMKKINYPRGMNFKQVMNACYLDTNEFPYKIVRIGNKKCSYSCDSCIFFGTCFQNVKDDRKCKALCQHDLSKGEVDLIKDILQPLKDENNPVIKSYSKTIRDSKVSTFQDCEYLSKMLNKNMNDLYTRTQIVHEKLRSKKDCNHNLLHASDVILNGLKNLSELGNDKKENDPLKSLDELIANSVSSLHLVEED